MMTRSIGWLVAVTATVSLGLRGGEASAQARFEYDGDFSEVQSSSAACDGVFAVTTYHNLHMLTGPTGRTSVLHFANDKVDGAFFQGINFVGLYGGSGDLYYEKTITKDGKDFAVLAEGFADRALVYLEFKVEARAAGTSDGEALCTAQATYAGFN